MLLCGLAYFAVTMLPAVDPRWREIDRRRRRRERACVPSRVMDGRDPPVRVAGQPAAFLTSSLSIFSSAAVMSVTANATGQTVPSSRAAVVSKPRTA